MKNNIAALLFFVIFLSSLQLKALPPDNTNQTSSYDIKRLIKKLGAVNFRERENAGEELEQLGYYAREEVKKALNSKDPEVRLRLKKIWTKIKWKAFPGAEDDVEELMVKLQPIAFGYPEWNTLSQKYGPTIITLLLDLNKKAQFRRQVLNGLAALLKTNPLNSIAEFIEKSSQKKEIIEMIKGLRVDKMHKRESFKLLNLLHKLNLKQESAILASSIWRASDSSAIPPEIAEYFQDKNFTEKIFETTEKYLNSSAPSPANDWRICFLAKVSKDIKRKELIKDLLNNIDYSITDRQAATYLAEILISMSLHTEAINVLSELHDPCSIYLRAVAYNNSGEKNHSKLMMEILSKKLSDKKSCTTVAAEMMKFKDLKAVTLWLKILKIKPASSIYDTNARFHLASFYESNGKYGKAAELLEEAIKKNISGKEAEKVTKQRINSLKAQKKGGSLIWFQGIRAMKKKDYKTALEKFNSFIEKNPNYHTAYYLKSQIYIIQGKKQEAIKELKKAAEHIKNNKKLKISFIIKQAILLKEQGEYKRAIKTIDTAIQIDPENRDILTMQGITYFYAGNYKKAAELFAESYKLNPDDIYIPLWKYISLKKIHLNHKNKFAELADTLNGDKWPIPIIRYYAGKITLSECIRQTKSKSKKRENEKKCEAYYFIGEFLILNNQKDEGVKLLKKCIECDIQNFREYQAAKLELKSEAE
jgi:lipoprotein NlpI